jgi:hypothetical protein
MGFTQKCRIFERPPLKVAYIHSFEKTTFAGSGDFTEKPSLFQPYRLLKHEKEEHVPHTYETKAKCSGHLQVDYLI